MVDFNWNGFAQEQARRQELASEGATIPVFDGHRLQGTQSMQYVDPSEIREALQSHQSLHFTPQVLQGNPLDIIADHELLVNAVSVVEDPTRTWDPCSSTGRKMGPWTFGAIMTAIANDNPSTHLVADQMVQSWLDLWSNTQTVNHFPVSARLGILGVLRPWRTFAHDQNNNVDISQAPFQLNAIVNRIDLTSAADPSGELRFVFGYSPCNGNEGQPSAFNVIVEFRVPVAQCTWASQWHSLDPLLGPRFNSALEAITDEVTNNASQNLDQVRTNEAFTGGGGVWEQKQLAQRHNAGRDSGAAISQWRQRPARAHRLQPVHLSALLQLPGRSAHELHQLESTRHSQQQLQRSPEFPGIQPISRRVDFERSVQRPAPRPGLLAGKSRAQQQRGAQHLFGKHLQRMPWQGNLRAVPASGESPAGPGRDIVAIGALGFPCRLLHVVAAEPIDRPAAPVPILQRTPALYRTRSRAIRRVYRGCRTRAIRRARRSISLPTFCGVRKIYQPSFKAAAPTAFSSRWQSSG